MGFNYDEIEATLNYPDTDDNRSVPKEVFDVIYSLGRDAQTEEEAVYAYKTLLSLCDRESGHVRGYAVLALSMLSLNWAQIMEEEDIPKEIRNVLGSDVRSRLDRMIHDVIMTSLDSPDIRMSDEVLGAMLDLRKFLFTHVYRNPDAKGEEIKAKRMIRLLYDFYMDQIWQA